MKISELEFPNNVFLAPMAGVTDIIFRGICKDMGCGLVYTEMISAKALYYGSENTKELLKVSHKESPVAVQIFGSEPLVMAKACDYFNDNKDICIVDINMGCPAHKIVKNGDGSALMKNPKLAADIVREVKRASIKPVTVKFRKGFDSSNINAVEFAKRIEDAGADAVTVHGRTREQMYEGKADWNIIAEVKEQLSIPVIGNGDVFSAEGALEIKKQTQCDGIMVARGAMGNPWIFREINQALKGEIIIKTSVEEKIDLCIGHLKLAVDYYGEAKAVREMRKNIAWYLKGLKNSTDIKNKVNYESDAGKVMEILKNYKSQFIQ
ncbi:MAG: tRNA dihydrouridine synthase DusB [Clostridium sp.]|uniref:tRNA dihydrouridine synthase DusB n=1 Tax=Clostridium sp. TaxID=1506 RepID=UPI0039E86BC8